MGVQAGYENWFYLRWPEKEATDVMSLFTKLYRYKNQAGFKNDGLGLTKRDREIIKQIVDCFNNTGADTTTTE